MKALTIFLSHAHLRALCMLCASSIERLPFWNVSSYILRLRFLWSLAQLQLCDLLCSTFLVMNEQMSSQFCLDSTSFLILSHSFADAGFLVYKLWEQADKDAFFAKDGLHCRALVPSHEGVDSQLMDRLPNLEIISNFGVGYDSIDVSAAKERGIRVTNTPDVLTEDVADLAIALLLDVSRRVTVGDRSLREGKWEFPVQRKASGKNVGILGLGRIGQAIATRAAAFNMKIAYHSRHEKSGVPYKYYSNLVDMAKAVDFLIIACPGGPSTRHLVTKEVMDALGPEGCLINIARGSVVVESDLVKALAEGRLGSAGLDVFENEPHVPEELKMMDNVVLQPHVGSATHETREAMASLVVANLKAHFSGKDLLTPVV